MRDLAMPHVRFAVALERQEDPQGILVERMKDEGAQRAPRMNNDDTASHPSGHYAFDKTGVDKIEFLLAPNPGEPLKPLARIASGGESARLLLALKSILSKVDEVPTLVFDEVDVGVGGRAGQVVGEKLWGISEQHQVICITHLPQVAAFGDLHFAIAKLFSGDRTRTIVEQLADDARLDEIAEMLDGTPISEHSRRGAQEMLDRAQTYKTNGRSASPEPMLAR
jgi:DNA repair protein RecN (Recombination protein N)